MILFVLEVAVAGFVDVDVRFDEVCARTAEGRVACTNPTLAEPVWIEGVDDAVAIETLGRSLYSCALRKSGRVHCWGRALPEFGSLEGVRYLSPDQEGGALCFGDASGHRCLFLGSYPWRRGREAREGPHAFDTEGPIHTTGLFSEPPLRCWIDRAGKPKCPPLQDDRTGYTTIAAHRQLACGVRQGRVICGGSDYEGGVGDGPVDHYDEPVDRADVTGPTDVVQVAVHSGRACTRSKQGDVWCWGTGYDSGLPFPWAVGPVEAPHQVPGLQAVDLSLGHNRSCAVEPDGRVACWGSWTTARPSPVPGITSVAELEVGEGGACARLASGEVRCWGQLLTTGEQPHLLWDPIELPEARGWKHLALKTERQSWALCGVPEPGKVACRVRAYDGALSTRVLDLPGVNALKAAWFATRALYASDDKGRLWWFGPDDPASPRQVELKGELVAFDPRVNDGVVVQTSDGSLWHHPYEGAPQKLLSLPPDSALVPTRLREVHVRTPAGLQVVRDGKLEPLGVEGESVSGADSPCALQDGRVRCGGKLREVLDVAYDAPKWLPIPDLSDVVELHGGRGHACVVHRDRHVSCFGSRIAGRLGTGLFERF